MFDLFWHEPKPLVPRYLRVDVDERLDYRGREVRPLDLEELALAVEHLVSHGVESIAICFLFSYLNQEHEHRAEEFIAGVHPELQVSTSSEILPQWREYQRASTTVADAYVKPVMGFYIDSLAVARSERVQARPADHEVKRRRDDLPRGTPQARRDVPVRSTPVASSQGSTTDFRLGSTT